MTLKEFVLCNKSKYTEYFVYNDILSTYYNYFKIDYSNGTANENDVSMLDSLIEKEAEIICFYVNTLGGLTVRVLCDE